MNLLKSIYFLNIFSISTVTANTGLSIQDNLSNFQLPGDLGPLSWGYLSPFSSKEQCLIQYKAGIHFQPFINMLFERSILIAFYKNESLLKLYHKMSDPQIKPQTLRPAKLATFSEAEDRANEIW